MTIRGDTSTIESLRTGEQAGISEDHGKKLIQFAHAVPDGITFTLNEAIVRYRKEVNKHGNSKKAFFESLAAGTNTTEMVQQGAVADITLSKSYIGYMMYKQWVASTLAPPDSREEALTKLGKRIATDKEIPHKCAPEGINERYSDKNPKEKISPDNSVNRNQEDSVSVDTIGAAIPESKLTNELIKQARKFYSADISPEMSYDHYGNRGRADLFLRGAPIDAHLTPRCATFVIEVKSKHAVEEATGANAIIQQYNRMREYFFAGNEITSVGEFVDFELAFTPDEECIRHLFEYRPMYETTLNQSLADYEDIWPNKSSPKDNNTNRVTTSIKIRVPEAEGNNPIHVFGSFNTPPPSRPEEYEKYIQNSSLEFYNEFWHIIQEYI